MICILYVNAIGALLAVAGILIERTLPPAAQRRWIWCGVIAISMAIPGIYQARHTAPINGLTGNPGATSEFWAWFETAGGTINTIWLSMTAALVLWGIVDFWRVSRIISSERKRTSTVDGLPVLVTESAGPATVGIFRSKVLVPRWVLALPKTQREYVLRHEEEHRRARDARLIFIASLTVLLAPWNLALWWQLRQLRLAVEVDCDNRVVNALGDPHSYGELLFKVAQASNRGPRLQPAFLGGPGMLERRLTSLLAPAQLQRAQQFLLPLLASIIILFVLVMPHPVLDHSAHAAMTSR